MSYEDESELYEDAPTPTAASSDQTLARSLARVALAQQQHPAGQMTVSYTEISHSDSANERDMVCSYVTDPLTPGPSRPLSLVCHSETGDSSSGSKPLDLDGLVEHEGDMTHFVADDLEHKIRLSSPGSRRESPLSGNIGTPLSASLYRQLLTPQIGQIDVTVLNDLEYEARKIATSVDSLIESLSDVLHSASSLTAGGVEAYRACVGRTCDALDRNIRAMYTVLARGEEVSRAMQPARAHAARLAEIRRLLHIMESTL